MINPFLALVLGIGSLHAAHGQLFHSHAPHRHTPHTHEPHSHTQVPLSDIKESLETVLGSGGCIETIELCGENTNYDDGKCVAVCPVCPICPVYL